MANEKRLIDALRAIERAIGKIEGVAFVLDNQYATPILDAIEVLDRAVEEITDGKID